MIQHPLISCRFMVIFTEHFTRNDHHYILTSKRIIQMFINNTAITGETNAVAATHIYSYAGNVCQYSGCFNLTITLAIKIILIREYYF